MTDTRPPSDTRDDEIAFQLSWLVQRLAFNQRLDEESGPRWGRSNESAAIAWAIDELGETYPEELDEAERLVEERHRRHQRRALRSEQHKQRLQHAERVRKEP